MNRFPDAESPDDLDWQAFCYLAGELDEAGVARFETLLAANQAAREALAAAVELTTALASVAAHDAPRTVAVQPRKQLRQVSRIRLAWVSVGAAACLAALWLGSDAFRRDAVTDPAGGFSAGGFSDGGDLADAWAERLNEPSDEAADGLPVDESETLIADAAEEVESLDAPDWMLVALGGHSSDSPDDALGDDMSDPPDGEFDFSDDESEGS